MALATRSSDVPAISRPRPADLCALVCAASAGAHGALAATHVHESGALAAAFTVAAAALVLAAVGEVLAPTRLVSRVVGALLLSLALAYVLSRTSGIPVLVEHPEPLDPLGVCVTSLEVAAAVLAVRQPNPRRHR